MRNNPFAYLIVTVLILALDFYVFQAVKTATRDLSADTAKLIRITYWVVTGVTLATVYATYFIHIEYWPKALRAYLFGGILVMYASKLILLAFLLVDDIIRLVKWVLNQFGNPAPVEGAAEASNAISRSKFISQLGLIVAAIPFSAGIWGMARNAYNYQFKRIKVPIANLPEEFEGFKIIQLSDIHSGSFTRTSPIIKAVQKIVDENADVIFFTGDLVNSMAEEFEPFVDIFGKLKAKEGVYSVFGNHDYGDYVRWNTLEDKEANLKALQNHQRGMGWDLLWDENRTIQRGDAKLSIIGVQNWSSNPKRFKRYGNLQKAYKGAESADVKLLLSHDPSHWDAEVTEQFKDIDVTFSGHTHGAQMGIEIPGIKWSPSQYIYKQWAGLYQKGKQFIYVNRGFGFIGFPGRVGILPEVTVMELEKA